MGATYRVRVGPGDNPAQYLSGDPGRSEGDLALFLLALGSGDGISSEFDLTVTSVDQTLGGEAAVTGIRVSDTSHVSVPLPPEIAQQLGLSADVDYVVEGVLKDPSTGQVVSLPSDQTLTVPVRWLHPLP
ncbi:hypothetical protein [Saccharopolyspora pogona]|uniref:hypothetical protein n=1 Tax=Saccharopolyspora pogona TaxID=333966 RepID=UPI0016844B0F|nr:hypothetical protein [Saccharopolyspora pogona]